MTARDAARKLKVGDYVLFRDPALFWLGKADHTTVCRVLYRYPNGRIDLADVLTNRVITDAPVAYTRLLAPEDAMRDIDTAPLDDEEAGAMSSAAIAWLRQQLRESAPTGA